MKDLRALLAAATPGEWQWDPDVPAVWTDDEKNTPVCFIGEVNRLNRNMNNAALIAALRNAAPALLGIVEAVAKLDPYHQDGAAVSCNVCCAWTQEGKPVAEVEHEEDCAWVLARKLTGGAT